MYGIIISVIVAIIVCLSTWQAPNPVWAVIFGVIAAIITQVVIGFILKKKTVSLNNKIQDIMQSAQVKINRQMQLFQNRPGGNVKAMQQNLEKMQENAIKETLVATNDFAPYYKWNPMLKRQINTMKMQLYFQQKDFANTDKMLKSCFLFDIRSKLIKLVRMYKTNDPKLDSYYKSKLSRIKGDDGALAACTYAWMKIKKEEPKKALEALNNVKKFSDHAVLMENYDRLVNGKLKHFSNANFGEQWYALYLEEPKMKAQQQKVRYMR